MNSPLINDFIAQVNHQIKRIGKQYEIYPVYTSPYIRLLVYDSDMDNKVGLTYMIIDTNTLNIYDATRRKIRGNLRYPPINFGLVFILNN